MPNKSINPTLLFRSKIAFLCIFVAGSCSSINRSPVEPSDVYISVDKPRHWTLDDAHYLISGVHRRARSLEVETPKNMDPNAFNSSRLEFIQTAVSAAVSMDEVVGKQNEVAETNLNNQLQDAQLARAEEVRLKAERETLRNEQLEAAKAAALASNNTATLQAEYDRIQSIINLKQARVDQLSATDAVTVARRATLSAEIEAHEIELANAKAGLQSSTAIQANADANKAAIDTRIGQIETDLTAAATDQTVPAVTLQQANTANLLGPSPEAGPVSSALTDTIIKTIAEDPAFQATILPSFNFSDGMEKYIDSENQLLARQLTLLRNEVGGDETIVFMQLPHTIHSARKVSKDRYVQVQWKVEDYCTINPYEKVRRDFNILGRDSLMHEFSTETELSRDKYRDELRRISSKDEYLKAACSENTESPKGVKSAKGEIVAWDLIPTSNAYNVADFSLQESELSLGLIFSRLTGFGAQGRFNRRRQFFEQFATQEVFASAYGQGSDTFGWVLGPKPGSDRVSSGSKTTYAALIVPKRATAVRLKGSFCILNSQSTIQPDSMSVSDSARHCQDMPDDFAVPIIPSQEYWIDEVTMSPSKSGGIATVHIAGVNFSPFQVSVMVNGTPLARFDGAPGSAKSIRINDTQNSQLPDGYFEVGDSENITMNFRMPADYEGTPDIALFTPGKTTVINNLKLPIDGYFFGAPPSLRLRYNSVALFQKPLTVSDSSSVGSLNQVTKQRELMVVGSGFYRDYTTFRVRPKGGATAPPASVRFLSGSVAVLTVPEAEEWDVIAWRRNAQFGGTEQLKLTRPAAKKSAPKTAKPPTQMAITKVDVVGVTPTADGLKYSLSIRGSNLPKCFSMSDKLSNWSVQMPKSQSSCDAYLTTETAEIVRMSGNELLVTATTASNRILIVLEASDPKDKSRFAAPLDLPVTPVISSIENSGLRDRSACGAEAGGELIVLTGDNLMSVQNVYFGVNRGAIKTQSNRSITVVSPPGTGQVLVHLQAKAEAEKPLDTDPAGVGFEYSQTSCGTRIVQ